MSGFVSDPDESEVSLGRPHPGPHFTVLREPAPWSHLTLGYKRSVHVHDPMSMIEG